ncbi:hypothetical protein GCM10010497_59160 [Streptomyces cinereoruber]|uniref:Uncharacterized protein n=1 Tax=Streptomyces cinereoruber TaxID=67260 RepID=A0AAV4KRN3_9ACTN|nr:hypothetical protein GCM10010497_59160 [Streptomyces cinereoruber]
MSKARADGYGVGFLGVLVPPRTTAHFVTGTCAPGSALVPPRVAVNLGAGGGIAAFSWSTAVRGWDTLTPELIFVREMAG